MHASPRPGRPRHFPGPAAPFATIAIAVILHAGSGEAQPGTSAALPDTGVSFVSPATAPAPAPPASPPPSTPPANEPPRASAPPPRAIEPPADLSDHNAWLDYKSRAAVALLPDEARLFYRRGLMAHEAGSREEAIQLVRAATQLDPTFPLPYLTLGSWFLLAEPGQALAHFASLLEVARQSFPFQLALQANALYLLLQALLLGLVVTALLVVAVHHHELRHRWQERLGRFLPRGHALFWSWVFLIAPFFLGFGPALPAVAFLGMLWPLLRWNERAVFVLLVATLGTMPWSLHELDRLGSPLREDRAPLYGVLQLENAPHSQALSARLDRLSSEHPDHAFIAFAKAWNARRGEDVATAEAAYRRVLALWPEDDRVLNNLGNVLTLQGRHDEALAAYERAAHGNPFNAAPHYNRARILTDRYEFRAAAEAMARASALNFDLLQPYQTQLGGNEALPPVDQWIAPRWFWSALASHEDRGPRVLAMPPAWRTRIECSGWTYSITTVIVAILGIVLGSLAQRGLPLRRCGNCGRVVCRRCAERRREIALCRDCGGVAARAESHEFARVLLRDHQLRLQRRARLWQTALATLVPGLGWILHRQAFQALVLLTVAAGATTLAFDLAAPFSYLPRIVYPESVIPLGVLLLPWTVIYLVSIAGYFDAARTERARLDAAAQPSRPARSRRSVTQAA